MKRRIILAVVAIAVVLGIAGTLFAVTRANSGSATLTDRTWTLTRLIVDGRTQTLLPNALPTLRLQSRDHTVSGSSGCNSYYGSYTLTGNMVRFERMQTTLMACFPVSLMSEEFAYSGALGRVQSYEISGDTLTLTGDSGRVVMAFQPGNDNAGKASLNADVITTIEEVAA